MGHETENAGQNTRNTVVLDPALQAWADDVKSKKQVVSMSELVRMCMREAREAIDKKLGRT